jgi:ribonuclease HI
VTLRVTVYTDGDARDGSAAAVITGAGGEVLDEAMVPLGPVTKNVAEYRAALLGLERAGALGATVVALVIDSELVVNQLTGRYRVRAPDLVPLHRQTQLALARFHEWSVNHVRRMDRTRPAPREFTGHDAA